VSTRRRTLAVLVAALLAGLCFAPVFGLSALLLPVGLVCLVTYLVTELCRAVPALLAWRPVLVAVGGLTAIIETVLRATTVAGLPTIESVRALGRGLRAWRLTLESTWPARPDADLVIFIPLLVLLACLLGLELLDRTPPLAAVAPGLVVVGVSQLYIALSGSTAVLFALGYGLVIAALLLPDWAGRTDKTRSTGSLTPLAAGAIMTVIAILGGFAVSAVNLARRTPYTLQQVQSTDVPRSRPSNPLDELAGRLSSGSKDEVAFRYQSPAPVGRWRQVTLDDFDGANWNSSRPFLRLGTELPPGPEIAVEVTTQRAEVELRGLTGPWLPGQLLPSSVSGAAETKVEPVGSTLMVSVRPDRYQLTWSKPAVDAKLLVEAGIDPEAPGGLGDLGAVPPEVSVLAATALAEKRATFATALALEDFMAKRYKVAVGNQLPSGHGWPQLRQFLLGDPGIGTSEQFAAGYVALARLSGIPARLVVGFRAPAKADPDGWYTVRNGDALAWPEVAVEGVGWWPLDPAGRAQAGKSAPAPGSDSDVTNQAREAVPPINEIEDPVVPPPAPETSGDRSWDGFHVPVAVVLVVAGSLLLLWVAGVPLLKFIRGLRRRRRTGSAAVVGAWAEARDRLRSYGVPVTSGMTVRDLTSASADVTDDRARGGLGIVAAAVDQALWSGGPASEELGRAAWAGVREIRRGLRSRPWQDRLAAALEVRSLI
jgi:protein-glutamine gamma-glutamyltransferase